MFLNSLSPALIELGQVFGFQDLVCSKACAFSSCVFLVLVWIGFTQVNQRLGQLPMVQFVDPIPFQRQFDLLLSLKYMEFIKCHETYIRIRHSSFLSTLASRGLKVASMRSCIAPSASRAALCNSTLELLSAD